LSSFYRTVVVSRFPQNATRRPGTGFILRIGAFSSPARPAGDVLVQLACATQNIRSRQCLFVSLALALWSCV
jgi:hypothetical protein